VNGQLLGGNPMKPVQCACGGTRRLPVVYARQLVDRLNPMVGGLAKHEVYFCLRCLKQIDLQGNYLTPDNEHWLTREEIRVLLGRDLKGELL